MEAVWRLLESREQRGHIPVYELSPLVWRGCGTHRCCPCCTRLRRSPTLAARPPRWHLPPAELPTIAGVAWRFRPRPRPGRPAVASRSAAGWPWFGRTESVQRRGQRSFYPIVRDRDQPSSLGSSFSGGHPPFSVCPLALLLAPPPPPNCPALCLLSASSLLLPQSDSSLRIGQLPLPLPRPSPAEPPPFLAFPSFFTFSFLFFPVPFLQGVLPQLPLSLFSSLFLAVWFQQRSHRSLDPKMSMTSELCFSRKEKGSQSLISQIFRVQL